VGVVPVRASEALPADAGNLTETRQVVVAPRSLAAFVAFLLGGVLLVGIVFTAREILTQLLAAIALAMALEPFVRWLEQRGLARDHAVGITFLLAVLGALAFGYLVLPPLAEEVARFIRDVPNLLQELTRGQGPLGFLETRFHVVEYARVWAAKHSGADELGPSALHALGRFLHTGASVGAVAFLTLFVGRSGSQWFDGLLQAMPEGSQERWRRVGRGVSSAIGGYVSGNLLISVIAGAFTTAVLLATRVPYPVPLGLVVGVLDLVPLVGATLGAVIVAAVALTKGVTTTAIVIAAMWMYQEIENHVLVQLVYHRTVKLSDLAIAVSVAAGAEIGGVVGALFAIPIAGALKVVFRELLAWRRGGVPPEDTEAPTRSWLSRWRERRHGTASG
jgi:predicted PurR-regulated permease PerM